jgi:mRNA-degrading endonuclease toxin of MazEF toxin-antitoxin module
MAVEPHDIRRGTVVIVRVPEDTKAGRPAVVIRSNALAATPWVAVLPFTTDLDTDMPQWVRVEPTPGNGLRQRSCATGCKPFGACESRRSSGRLPPRV